MNFHQQLAASLITRSQVFEPKTNSSILPSAELSASLADLTTKSFDPVASKPLTQPPLAQQQLAQNNTLPAALGFGKVTHASSAPLRTPVLQAPQVTQALAMLQELRNKSRAQNQGPRIIGSSSFRASDLSTRAKIYPPKSNG